MISDQKHSWGDEATYWKDGQAMTETKVKLEPEDWQATHHLRWRRNEAGERILQQQWEAYGRHVERIFEWRDVPEVDQE